MELNISVVTYSFNPGIEDMNIIIQNCLDSGSDNLELMGNQRRNNFRYA